MKMTCPLAGLTSSSPQSSLAPNPTQLTTTSPDTSLRSSTNDWTISWKRVSRAPRQYELSKLGPLDVDPIQAKVEIKATAGGSILRTITVEGADTVTYTSAQQTADCGSAQSSLNFDVYNYTDAGDGSHTVETNVVDVFGA